MNLSYDLLCLDVDGVLTDGRFYVSAEGVYTRAFHAHDGFAIKWFQKLGGRVAIITGKTSHAVVIRARELGIDPVVLESHDKATDFKRVLDHTGCTAERTIIIGDDLPDLPMLQLCGYPVAVADAAPEIRSMAHFVTTRNGGDGAIREAVERILRADGAWNHVVEHYNRVHTPHQAT